MARVLIDQYHVDIYQTAKLTAAQLKEIERAFSDRKWIATLLEMQFDSKLRKKLKIEITT